MFFERGKSTALKHRGQNDFANSRARRINQNLVFFFVAFTFTYSANGNINSINFFFFYSFFLSKLLIFHALNKTFAYIINALVTPIFWVEDMTLSFAAFILYLLLFDIANRMWNVLHKLSFRFFASFLRSLFWLWTTLTVYPY